MTDPYMLGEWFNNRDGVTHVVPNPDDIGVFGDAGTVCGRVVVSASREPLYPVCPGCVKGLNE